VPAQSGSVDETALAALMGHEFFHRTPPGSLDPDSFDAAPVRALSPEVGAGTLQSWPN
jgi:anhydro-N-acetylmuramic acid kinase